MLAPRPEPPRAEEKVEEKLVLVPIPKPTKPIVESVPVREPEVVTPRLPEVRITEARPAPAIPEPPPRVTPLPPPPPIPLGEAKALPAPAPPVVVTNVFSTVASPTVTAPVARKTEASGFGDAETRTSSAQTRVGRPDGIGTLTGFDASGVPGGRGAPGRSGSVVASTLTGFDAGGVPGGRGTSGRGGSVMASGFADTATLPKSAAPAPKAPATGIEKPVEITFKPRPEYTDDARKMRIEGEALVRVTFTQSGSVRVLEVIRGLGYGLDENAVRAAEQIKFKPAQRAGQPVDSTAVVHIVFQLAY